jgi:hypothetical protein
MKANSSTGFTSHMPSPVTNSFEGTGVTHGNISDYDIVGDKVSGILGCYTLSACKQ